MKRKSRITPTAWPWGKTPPGRRMRDIDGMIEKTKAQIPIIEDQAREAIRRVRKNIQALEAQKEVVASFMDEEMRAQNKKIAYELATLGIDLIHKVDEANDQDALNKELLKLLGETQEADSKTPGELDEFLDSMKD